MGELSAQIRKLRLLAACATFFAETLLELINTTCGIDKALLTSEERVAGRANTDVQILHRRASLNDVATSALNRCFVVFWMDIRFHDRIWKK